LTNLGHVVRLRGDLDTAESSYRRALAIQERAAPGSLEMAWSLHNLALVAKSKGDLESAERSARQSLHIKQKVAPDSLQLVGTLTVLCDVAYQRGNLQAAASHARRAVDLTVRAAPGTTLEAGARYDLGAALAALDRSEEALQEYLTAIEAVEMQQARLGGSGDERGRFRSAFSMLFADTVALLVELGRRDAALDLF
jgi:Flp pilus assembly protein TadD